MKIIIKEQVSRVEGSVFSPPLKKKTSFSASFEHRLLSGTTSLGQPCVP